LKRWGISWKCGRIHFVSPDPDYEAKQAAIHAARRAAAEAPEQVRVFFADEAGFYRFPHPGHSWSAQGSGGTCQPKADHTAGANTRRRIIAALDACTAEVFWDAGKVIGVKQIKKFLRALRRHVGAGVRVVLVWDNWPVHKHPDVLRVAQAEAIELLFTPTYAPWTNPIEKLWKKLRHDTLHLHAQTRSWTKLCANVTRFLRRHEEPSPDLLRYVGLARLPI
jgi:transposase